MRELLLIIGTLLTSHVLGQSIDRQIVSSYGNLSNTVSATVGEVITATHTVAGMYTLNQGFQQAPKNMGTSLEELAEISLSYQLHPNPASEVLHIKLQSSDKVELEIYLINSLGQQVLDPIKAKFNGDWDTQVKVENLAAGMYILELVDLLSKHKEAINFLIK